MLTFILLVVLAGGVGLIAVSAAEHDDPATKSRRSRRERTSWFERLAATDEDPAGRAPPAEFAGTPSPAMAPDRERPTATATMAPSTPRRATRGDVPESLTAVEGAFEIVAVRSPARRIVSLGFVIALVAVVAIVIAAVTGASFAIIGRLLDSAIG